LLIVHVGDISAVRVLHDKACVVVVCASTAGTRTKERRASNQQGLGNRALKISISIDPARSSPWGRSYTQARMGSYSRARYSQGYSQVRYSQARMRSS
jgi:hypothetical protein